MRLRSVPEKPSEKNPPEDTNTGVQVKKMTWIVLALCSFGMIVILGRRFKKKINVRQSLGKGSGFFNTL